MQPRAVGCLHVLEDGALGATSRVGKQQGWTSSIFNVATKLSEMALSSAEPALPIERMVLHQLSEDLSLFSVKVIWVCY